MGIYDRDYYKNRKRESSLSQKVFKFSWYLIVALFILAFIVYVLAVFSEK